MSRHVSYRGITIDMDSLRRENEKSVAIGNMPVNARGDLLDKGKITKTADQLARENHRVQSIVTNAGLKGPEPEPEVVSEGLSKVPMKATKTKSSKEVELPSGDIVIEDDTSES